MKYSTKMINSCRYVPLKERVPDYDDVTDKSSQINGTKDLARPSPKKEIFSKRGFRKRRRKSCQYIASKKGTHRATSQNTFWIRYHGNTISYVNAGNLYNQRYSDEPGSIVDEVDEEDNACYYRSPASEIETEDRSPIMLATTDLPQLKQKPRIKKRRNREIEAHVIKRQKDPTIDLLPPHKYFFCNLIMCQCITLSK